MNPRRLTIEAWRDTLLFVTRELDVRIGGPPEDLLASNRRTLYGKVSRSGDAFESDEFLRLFDFPIPRGSQAQRATSTVPQQFLFMLNSPFMIQRAKAFARRLEDEVDEDSRRIERAYGLLYGRPPTQLELRLGLDFVTRKDSDKDQLTLWQQYAQALLSANELMHVE